MKVLLYSEKLDQISKSGLGKAIKHQMQALDSVGIEYTLNPKESFDILHINTYFPSSKRFAQQCHKVGIPVIYHAHSTEEDFKNSFILSNQLAPLFKKWLISCYKIGDLLITPTPYSKKILDSYGMNRDIVALSNGIDLANFKPIEHASQQLRAQYNLDDTDFVVIGIGLYIERKGILDFIELAHRMPHIKFIWFGYTDLRIIPQKIRDRINNAPDNLIFAGYVNNDLINLALQGCNLFLFTTFEETEGIPVIEACAAKANFIVRDIPVFDGWLEHNQHVYKAKSLDEFEHYTQQAYDGQLPSLSKNAYSIAEERSIINIGTQLKQLYTLAIAKSKIK